MPRPAKESRENFVAGRVDSYSVGERGVTVRILVESGRIKVRHRDREGRRRQRSLFDADSPALRGQAVDVASAIVRRLKEGRAAEEEERLAGDGLTVFQAIKLYMARMPAFQERLLNAPLKEIKAWYAELPVEARSLALWTIISDIYGFRRLWKDARFAPGRLVEDIEPGDGSGYYADYVAAGNKPATAVNDLDRLSCAFRYVIQQHRRSVGLLYNPLEGRRVERKRTDVDAYDDEEVVALRKAALELAGDGEWQVYAAVQIATSGRRIGSIRRLTLDDHDLEAGVVTWLARNAKGEHYGRGDETRPMTAHHRRGLEWTLEHHPNPKGSGFPVLWRSGGNHYEPAAEEPVPYSTVHGQLQRAEKLAGVESRGGRAWHAFRRWAVTKLADELGDGAASEFVGMTIETVRAFSYKKVQEGTMRKAADVLGGKGKEAQEGE